MGLTVLPNMELIIQKRKKVVDFYINNLNFEKIRSFQLRECSSWNYSYYPVIFESEDILIQVQQILNCNDIYPRRYFYPSLNKIEYVNGEFMPVSESIAERIMCLPLYVGLTEKDLDEIVNLINSTL